MEKKKSYSILTMITMIVGIVVGSGIYFRADDILAYTDGSLLLGMIVLALGAYSIMTGSIALSKLSSIRKTNFHGGLISYYETYVNKRVGTGFGWFQLFVYLPSISIVVGWAASLYTFMLLGIEATLLSQIILGLFYGLILLLINTFNRIIGGYIQNVATAIKLIPLFILAFAGIFLTQPLSLEQIGAPQFGSIVSQWSWLSALVPLAYSYDGWTVALNITSEVRNPKINIPRALIISPIIILITYLLYFYGITSILGPEQVLALGDEAVFEASKQVLGNRLGNLVLVVIIISVLGVVNGLVLGAIRLPQAMAEKNMMPDKGISTIHPKYLISMKSALMFAGLMVFWAIIHYVVMHFNIFGGHDVSEIAIVFNYLCYILLYRVLYKMSNQENQPRLKVIAVLAMLGSLLILVGSLVSTPLYVIIFMLCCAFVMFVGMKYYDSKN